MFIFFYWCFQIPQEFFYLNFNFPRPVVMFESDEPFFQFWESFKSENGWPKKNFRIITLNTIIRHSNNTLIELWHGHSCWNWLNISNNIFYQVWLNLKFFEFFCNFTKIYKVFCLLFNHRTNNPRSSRNQSVRTPTLKMVFEGSIPWT